MMLPLAVKATPLLSLLLFRLWGTIVTEDEGEFCMPCGRLLGRLATAEAEAEAEAEDGAETTASEDWEDESGGTVAAAGGGAAAVAEAELIDKDDEAPSIHDLRTPTPPRNKFAVELDHSSW
jgi:hypothetical protein